MSKAGAVRPRVYVRCRPLNENELVQGSSKPIFYCERGTKDVLLFEKELSNSEKTETMKTRFDRVFDMDTKQSDVYDTVGTEIMSTLFNGYNATVFAYGQTGSGKTWTMVGEPGAAAANNNNSSSSSTTAAAATPGCMDDNSSGLIPRCINAIFDKFSSNEEITDAKVEMSMVQIYQEKVQDLFQYRKGLEIHLDRTGQYVAQNALWHTIKTPKQAISLFYEGAAQRATNATDMNMVSSRSHTILMLRMQWDEPSLPGSHAQLNLVDLAGSEKLYQSNATGEVMKETIAINKSLSALGNVVSRLVDSCKHRDRRVHVPYKDSKLTYLLQSSLGGSNLVHFILALSGSSLYKQESMSTVEFGKRALQLVLKPVRNPIDYKRLEEMEAMIETMRNRIRNLEEELKSGGGASGNPDLAAQLQFLQMKQLQQEGEEKHRKQKPKSSSTSGARAQTARTSRMRSRAELSRIIANLPETLEDLTSHCILFPTSREDFRNLGGLEKLVHLIDRSPSTFYRAHAAHTVAHVIDDEGRIIFARGGGIEVVERLLLVKEERCKEAACAALEAAVRNCMENKLRVTRATYEAIVDLTYGYPNQQVQEAACTVLASLVDGNPSCRVFLNGPGTCDAVRKLLLTIKEAPEEVVHVTKAAATCIGRLAHGDAEMQKAIREHGGIDLLIDHVLFSSSGDRDHQVPILASYALVNLCCSNAENMKVVQEHKRYDEVRFRLMEGLARAFGNNTVREQYARATSASEAGSPFPYAGVTVTDKWSPVTCGGRPIFSSFHENPQFFLYVEQDTNVSLMIQDTLYEIRMQQKMRNATVYMGLAVFQGETELANSGLKQLDFHGRMVEIAKFTSNCENVLHCTLKKSEAPYIVVPFASQRGRQTNFALSSFGDKPINLVPIPETTGWCRRVVHGAWTSATAGGGDTLLWRNNPQVLITARENTKVVFVLSYLSLDFQRCAADKRSSLLGGLEGATGGGAEGGGEGGAGGDEKSNNRPRMHGRLYKNNFAPDRRYAKHFAALPTSSSFVAGNTYSSNSYVTVAANLKAGESYAFVPFTETPVQDSFRLCVFTVSDEVDVKPLKNVNEWKTSTIPGIWSGEQLRLSIKATGKMSFVVNSPGVILRASVFAADQQKLFSPESLFSGETWVDLDLPSAATSQPCTVIVEGFVRADKQSPPTAASGQPFHLITYLSDDDGLVSLLPGEKKAPQGSQVPKSPLVIGSSYNTSLAQPENETPSAENPGFYPVAVAEEEDPLDVASLQPSGSSPGSFGAFGEEGEGDGDFDEEYENDESADSILASGDSSSGGVARERTGSVTGGVSSNNNNNNAEIVSLKEKNTSMQKQIDTLSMENVTLKNKLEQAEAQIEKFKRAAMMNQQSQRQQQSHSNSNQLQQQQSSSSHQQQDHHNTSGGNSSGIVGVSGGGRALQSYMMPTRASSSSSSAASGGGGGYYVEGPAVAQGALHSKTPTLPHHTSSSSSSSSSIPTTSSGAARLLQQQNRREITPLNSAQQQQGAGLMISGGGAGAGRSSLSQQNVAPPSQNSGHHHHANSGSGSGLVRSSSAAGRNSMRPSSSSSYGMRRF